MNKLVTVFLYIFLFLSLSCNMPNSSDNRTHKHKPTNRVEEIKKRGKLIIITDFNSVDYFIYKGQPMGFNYELAKAFADYLGVTLDVQTNYNLKNTFRTLQEGACDILAMGLTVTKDRTEFLQFSKPIMQTRQVLVQRKPKAWKKMTKRELDKHLIRSTLDLANKNIIVEAHTSYCERLKSLSQEIGDTIKYVGTSEFLAEDLIQQVADGRIDYTISDEHIAMVSQTYYPNIDIETPISFEQNLAWAIGRGDTLFLNELNNWLTAYKKSNKFAFLFAKYFKNPRTKKIAESKFSSFGGGKISPFDKEIKKESAIIGWDWRLLASLIYTESRFNPNVKSWAGAFGLMQLMPVTAQRFGVSVNSPPDKQIAAGVQFLKWLDDYYKKEIPDSTERIKFVLAAYNVGQGHVDDARALAKKYGKNPNVWSGNVDYFILQKSKPEFYKDEVVKYGYCRGIEPYNYVSEIFNRYNNYKNLIKS
ncbi:MAG: transporter substrate-binding domain-containing protein [Bacteroidales bacterium]|nr:transporter substrate-binding domain-containing protein [Bacteroidales bacterium]